MELFNDRVQGALERALDGVALRQRVTSANIANAMTPGYRAQRVEFEGALSAAMAGGGSPEAVALSVRDAGGTAREDGNNVELEQEATSLMRSGLQYEALVQAANYRHGVLRAALR
jgi:flagellar basal-body rod protein FlgB